VPSFDVVSRFASYGLELVDKLTGKSLVGASRVMAEAVASPGVPADGESFVVNRSRWAFENLPGEVIFAIDTDHYLTESITTGVAGIPSVPPAGQPGVLHAVELLPKPGYPFPPNLTRVVGLLTYNAAPVPDADVTVTPIHSEAPLVEGSPFVTRTGDGGQYVAWFLPDIALDPQAPVKYRVDATGSVDATNVEGSLSAQDLTRQTFNGAPTIVMTEVP
jgi:hypothetical protein